MLYDSLKSPLWPPPSPFPFRQAIEHAFKNETIGLVTREQFVEKRLTIEERLKAEQKRIRHEAEEEALRVGAGGGAGGSVWRVLAAHSALPASGWHQPCSCLAHATISHGLEGVTW